MRINEGVEWGAHCAVVLALLPEGASLPAARLAEYHGVPAPYLAKSLQALMRAGIVESSTGRRGGYRLGKPASEITLLDVFHAVEGDDTFFRCTEIRRQGPSRVAAYAYPPTCESPRPCGGPRQPGATSCGRPPSTTSPRSSWPRPPSLPARRDRGGSPPCWRPAHRPSASGLAPLAST